MIRSVPFNDDIPSWPIVQSAAQVGIHRPLDNPWCYAGKFGRKNIGQRINCMKTSCGTEFMLSRERFPAFETLWIGQCPRCGIIHWGFA